MSYLHGVEVIDIDAGPRPIQTVASAVIGIVGTAPDAQAVAQATLGTGTVAAKNALTFTAVPIGALGNGITVTLADPKANSAALGVVVTGKDIVVNLATSAGGAITSTAAQVIAAITASADASALVAVANTSTSDGTGAVAAAARTSLAGGLDEAFPLNTPVLIAGSAAQAAKLGATGTLPQALDDIFDQCGAVVIVVRVDVGADDAATMANVIGGTNAGTGNYEGVHALRGAESVLGFKPRILCAPGFTHQKTGSTANAVVAELQGIADRLRAIVIADATDGTDADAINYRGDWGSKRIYCHYPFDTKLDSLGNQINVPASARIAGQIAWSDNERGFWWSPSNVTVNGIIGTAVPVDFSYGDENCRANLLNSKEVATTIRQDGYRLWGNRTCSADPKWAFLSVVRTADIINDSILAAHLWAVDRGITKTYVQDVQEGVRDFLRNLKAKGAIIDGDCWLDKDLNTPDQIAQGHVYWDFDFSAVNPAERLTFRSHLTNKYLTEIF
jgi:hypothetical protein